MRHLPLIALACAAQVLSAGEPETARQKMAALFKKEFQFDSEAAAREQERRARFTNDNVIVLETMHVRDKTDKETAALDEVLQRIEAEKFNWRGGGTILKGKGGLLSPDLKFKYNPDHNGIDILNFSW